MLFQQQNFPDSHYSEPLIRYKFARGFSLLFGNSVPRNSKCQAQRTVDKFLLHSEIKMVVSDSTLNVPHPHNTVSYTDLSFMLL